MQLTTTSEAPMPGSRFSAAHAITAVILVLLLVSGVAVAIGSSDESDRSATESTSDSTSESAEARQGYHVGGAAPTATTVVSGDEVAAPATDEDSAAPSSGTPTAPAPAPLPPAPLPGVAPLAPPAPPAVGPLATLNIDPAAAGITGYQGLGVPAPANYGGPGSYSVGTGCASSCIDSGIAYPLGTGAHIEVATDTPARIWIVVWNEGLGQTFMTDSGAGSKVTSFQADFTELDSGTTYQAMAVAQDVKGYTDHAYGELETLRRNVRFGLSNVVVTSQPANTMSFSTGKWVDDQIYPGGWETPFPTIEDVDESVELVLLLEAKKECDDFCNAHPGWDHIPTSNPGSFAGYEWILLSLWDLPGQNRLPIELDDTPALVESPTARTFVLTLTNGPEGGALPGDYGPFGARVDVTVWVTYS